jgi:hypothetical protein
MLPSMWGPDSNTITRTVECDSDEMSHLFASEICASFLKHRQRYRGYIINNMEQEHTFLGGALA